MLVFKNTLLGLEFIPHRSKHGKISKRNEAKDLKRRKKKPLVKPLSQLYFDFFLTFRSRLIWKNKAQAWRKEPQFFFFSVKEIAFPAPTKLELSS